MVGLIFNGDVWPNAFEKSSSSALTPTVSLLSRALMMSVVNLNTASIIPNDGVYAN